MSGPLHNRLRKAATRTDKGDPGPAVELLEELDPESIDDATDAANAARLAVRIGKIDQAAVILALAVKRFPEDSTVLTDLGDVYMKLGDPAAAQGALEQSLALSPDKPSTHAVLGKLYLQAGQFRQAYDSLTRATELDSANPEIEANLCSALSSLGEHDRALKHARRALQLAPQDPGVHSMAGQAFLTLGHVDEARTHFDRARRLNPFDGAAYANLAGSKKFTEKDRKFIDQAEQILQQGMPSFERGHIHFALGKVYDDLGDQEKAYRHFQQGNTLKKPAVPDDPQGSYRRRRALKLPRTDDILGDLPVFVVGMPRSGTTLVEQILSSHSQVAGAGELPNLLAMVDRFADGATEDAVLEGLQDYRDTLRHHGGDQVLRVVDKTPSNFMCLGLIPQLMPQAKVIHIARNPLDTCLSCYFQNFTQQMWSFDLDTVGRYYVGYRQAMEDWRTALPDLQVMDVSYQALVEDTEGVARQMVSFIGLEWEDACLDYAASARPVMTASNWQVRRPVYTSSLKRWEAYASHLQPLVNQISPYLENEDAALLSQYGVKVKRGLLSRLFG